MSTSYYQNQQRGTLAKLRALVPERPLAFDEALRIAELQASRLLELSDVTDGPVPDDIVLALPRIERRYHRLRAASGMTYWNGSTWVIGINGTEPLTRQRFTLLHELKHIVDHRSESHLYRGDRLRTAERQAELAADYFAGCVLVPKRLLRRAWYNGEQRVEDLARRFEVSTAAIKVRLSQVGLSSDLALDQPSATRSVRLPKRPANWYFRTSDPLTIDALGAAPCPT